MPADVAAWFGQPPQARWNHEDRSGGQLSRLIERRHRLKLAGIMRTEAGLGIEELRGVVPPQARWNHEDRSR